MPTSSRTKASALTFCAGTNEPDRSVTPPAKKLGKVVITPLRNEET
jgi:hypothetical protein